MIKYRPQRGSIEQAIKEEKEFNTIEEMYNAIIVEWNNKIKKENLSITEDVGVDNRIGWKETRYICAKQIGNQIYDIPQCVGYCSIED